MNGYEHYEIEDLKSGTMVFAEIGSGMKLMFPIVTKSIVSGVIWLTYSHFVY